MNNTNQKYYLKMKRHLLNTSRTNKIDQMSLNEVEALAIRTTKESDIGYAMLEYCLIRRKRLLNDMFDPTPEDVERFRHIAQMLVSKTEMLYRNAGKIFRELNNRYNSGDCGDFSSFYVEAKMTRDWVEDFFIGLNNGTDTDTPEAAEILSEYISGHGDGGLLDVSLYYQENNGYDIEEYIAGAFSLEVQSGIVDTTWEDYLFDIYPVFKGIPICYALHHLFDHTLYSMQDILDITEVRTEIKIGYINDNRYN